MDMSTPSRVPRPPRDVARRLLSGAAWALVAKLAGSLSMLGAHAVLARMLSPREMGAYFLLTSVVVFAAIIARLGLKQTVVRLIAESVAMRQLGRARHALRLVGLIVTFGTALVGIAYYELIGTWLAEIAFDTPVLGTVLGVTTAWIAILAFQTPIAETFRGLHDIRSAVLLEGTLASCILASVLIILHLAGITLSFGQAVSLTTIAAGISLAIGTVCFFPRAAQLRGNGSITLKEILNISTPIFVSNVANQAMTNFSLWIAGAMLASHDVALYGAAWTLVMLVVLPLHLVNMTVQPVISELLAIGQHKRLETALRGMATLAGVPAFSVLSIYVLLGGTVLAAAYGQTYHSAALPLMILSAGMLCDVYSGSCGLLLMFSGHQKGFMYATLLTSVISCLITLVGAYWHGIVGIATGVAIGRLVQNATIWLLAYRLTGIKTHLTLSPSLILRAVARVRS